MLGNGDRLAGMQHNDILTAIPDTSEEKERIVEELKRRGNAAYKMRSLLEAETLYSKAIEHAPELAPLWGNRSMTRLQMGKAEEAASDAREAIKADESWAKGYFRLGQALFRLKNYEEAIASFEKILLLEPNNKAPSQEIEKCKKAMMEAKSKRGQEEEKRGTFEKKKVVTKKIISADVEKKPDRKLQKEAEREGEADLSMRGYRTLADGRKTTYFNMEQSEEDKMLLAKTGKLQPAKLAADEEIEISKSEQTGSVWNQGNTFEERDHSQWAVEKLKALIEGTSVEGSSRVTINVEKLSAIEGGASVAVTRGKQRHIFDFSFLVEWEAEIEGYENKNIKGGIFYPDFNGDEAASGATFETELRWPASNREQAKEYQMEISTGLKKLIHEIQKCLEKWVAEFHKQK